MRTLTQALYYPSMTDRFKLWFLSDLHLGAKACAEKLLARHIKEIADDPFAIWIGGGDYIDAIPHHDRKRYKPETIAKWALGHTNIVGKQKEYFLDMTAPIASKCMALATGNHEFESDKHYAGSVYWDMVCGVAGRKGVPPGTLALGVEGFIQIAFRLGAHKLLNGGNHAWRMTTFVHHGFGGAMLKGGTALTLERLLNRYRCDLLLFGHRHTLMVVDRQETIPGGQTARLRQSYAVAMPGYLRAYIDPMDEGMPVDTYAEQKGMSPQGVGAFPIEIMPSRRKLRLLVESGQLGN